MDKPDSSFVHKMVDDLFTPARARLLTKIVEYLRAIPEISICNIMSYRGQFYDKATGEVVQIPSAQAHIPKELPIQAVPTFQGFLNERTELDKDEKAIKQVISLLIEDCHNEQDLRDALPEMLVSFDLKQRFARTREPAFTLTMPRQIDQYNRYYRKICLYASHKLLY